MKKSDLKMAHKAGAAAISGIPRWVMYLIVILAIFIGGVVRSLLVTRYSLSRSEGFLFAAVAVMLLGLVGGLATTFGPRGKGR